MFENGEYCHIMLIKSGELFMFKEYKTMNDIPFTIAKKVLKLAQMVDYSSYAIWEKPDTNCFEKLYNLINANDCYFRDKNIIVNISNAQLIKKPVKFTINDDLPISNMDVVITNMQTVLTATLTQAIYVQIRNLDRIFFIQANSEKVFRNLLCDQSIVLPNNLVKLVLSTEHEHYLRSTIMQKTILGGSILWAFEITKHLTNLDRDIPIEIEMSGIPPQSRRIFFVFAIYGLSIPYDLRFGSVTFSNESGIDNERTFKFLELTNRKPDCYAQVAIFETNIDDAISNAKKIIKKAIELLQIIMLDDSTTFFFETQNTISTNWCQSQLSTRLDIESYFYLEDVENNMNYAIIQSQQLEINTSVQISSDIFDLLNNENVIENFFYLKNKKNDDLLQSIYLLNQSYKTKELEQRVIYLYNSIEFLLTGESGKKLHEELSAYHEYEHVMKCIENTINKITNAELKQRVSGALNNTFSGNSSVKSKLETLVNKIGLQLSKKDWELFDKLKNNRQKLIHNKKLSNKITNQELDELYHLISKIIINDIIFITNKEVV